MVAIVKFVIITGHEPDRKVIQSNASLSTEVGGVGVTVQVSEGNLSLSEAKMAFGGPSDPLVNVIVFSIFL